MRMISLAFAAVLALAPAIAAAQAAAPAAASAAKFSTETSTVGEILDDPAAKAVVSKHLPDLLASDQIDMARDMTLKTLQGFAPDRVSDAALTAIDADFAKLPAKK